MSIYIGNSKIVSILVVIVALAATWKWLTKPLPWIALVSVIAANPVNTTAGFFLNLIFAVILLAVLIPKKKNLRKLKKIPSWIYWVLLVACLSALGGMMNWDSRPYGFGRQVIAVITFVIGPFFFLPLIYFRLQKKYRSSVLLKIFVFSLLVPSLLFIFIAWAIGIPEVNLEYRSIDSLVNIAVYDLGKTRFILTRTQVGIILASICVSSMAILICKVNKFVWVTSLICLLVAVFMLLVTGSMGSSLFAVCGMVMVLVVALRFISIKRYLVIPVLFGILLLSWQYLPQEITSYSTSRFEDKFADNSIKTSDRSDIWAKGLQYLLKNPEGRGWELYIKQINTYPHNDYISYGIAYGVACGILYLFVPLRLLYLMMLTHVHRTRPAAVALLLAGVGVITVMVLNSLSDHLTANRWYFNVVWSMIWFCYFATRTTKRSYSIK